MLNLTSTMRIVRGNAAGIDRSSRIGDFDKAIEMELKVQEFQTIGQKVVTLYNAGDVEAARLPFYDQLRRDLRLLDREVLKLTFESRLKINKLAKVNKIAYRRSRQLVLGASGLAVVLALALGYLISASIIRPVERIRAALRAVAAGNFTAKAKVANRGELGDLAQSVHGSCRCYKRECRRCCDKQNPARTILVF